MKQRNSIKLGVGLMVMAILGVVMPAIARGHSNGSSGCSGAGGQSFNVTSIFADTDSNAVPFQLQSDGKGAYSTYTLSKRDSAVSEIQAVSCDWVLDLNTSTERTIKLTLAYPASTGAALPVGWPTDGSAVNVAARLISKCEDNPLNNHISFGTMTFAGQTLECPVHATFTFNGVVYSFRLNPSLYAGTTWAQVACTGAASNQCNAWTITPIPNTGTNPSTGQTSGIAEMVQPTCFGCIAGTPIGLFYVDFSVTAHK